MTRSDASRNPREEGRPSMTSIPVELLINDSELEPTALDALRGDPAAGPVTASPLRPVHNGFRAFINAESFDVSEIAIVTLLQALASGKKVLFLPLTALGRYQHHTLISTKDLGVEDLPGRTVGVRAWSQTTGVWVRGFLAEQYGIDLTTVGWRTYSAGHVPEQPEPAWVTRAAEGHQLAGDLLSGAVDFAMMGNDRPDAAGVHSVIDSPDTVARDWATRVGYIPVNHVFGVSEALAGALPRAVCAAYDALAERLAVRNADADGLPMFPFGFAGLRPAVTAAARFAWDQGLLPRQVEYDELVDRTCAALGVRPDRLGG